MEPKYVCDTNGHASVAVIVIGDGPMAKNDVHDAAPEQETVVVAMLVIEPTPEAYTTPPLTRFVVVESPDHEMTGVAPPDERIGYVAVTDVTPPAEVVVAMIFPSGSTARIVPAGVASEVSHTELVAVRSEVEAFVNLLTPLHQLLSTKSVEDAELPPLIPRDDVAIHVLFFPSVCKTYPFVSEEVASCRETKGAPNAPKDSEAA